MKLTPIAISIVLSLLSACGSDSSSDAQSDNGANDSNEDQTENKYVNDQMLVVTTAAFTFSTGQSDSYQNEDIKTYLEVDSIPSKYSYSGNITGPYKLEITTQGGVVDGHEYSSSTGVEIIDDNFEEFESVDFTDKQGSDTPDDIQFGDSLEFYENATLFDSTSGEEVGSKVIEMTLQFVALENVTVLAGTFDAVKVSFEMTYEKNITGEQQEASTTGAMWLDIEHGYSLKSVIEGTFNYPYLSVSAEAVISTELKYVYIEEDKNEEVEAKARGRSSSFTPINLNLKNIANEVASNFH